MGETVANCTQEHKDSIRGYAWVREFGHLVAILGNNPLLLTNKHLRNILDKRRLRIWMIGRSTGYKPVVRG